NEQLEKLRPRSKVPVTKQEARIIMFCILSDIKTSGPNNDKRARKVAREQTGFSIGVVRSVHNRFNK
ncbi:unnamed protein product, partial [Ectocarpus fasciculatus]